MDDLLRALGFTRPDWMADALCREPGYAELDWVPASPTAQATAQRLVCSQCLVRAECLAHAVEHNELGVWGGTDERERRATRRDQAA